MVWQRATKPEHKEQRRCALLDAAARLFEREGFEQVSLNAIARAANISKANVYRYFESREQLFLQLFLDDLRAWLALVETEFRPLEGSEDDDAVVDVLVQSMLARPRLGALMAVLTGVLERNLSVDAVVAFKTEMLAESARLAGAIKAALPSLADEALPQLLMTMFHLTAGMWPAAHPSQAVAEALRRPELQQACVQFDAQMRQTLRTYLRGLRAEHA